MDILIKNKHGREVPVPRELAQKIKGQVEIKGEITGHKNGQYQTRPIELENAPKQEKTMVDLQGREIPKEQWEKSQRAKTRR